MMNYPRLDLALITVLVTLFLNQSVFAQASTALTNAQTTQLDTEGVSITKTAVMIQQISDETDRYAKASKRRSTVTYVSNALTRYPNNVVLLRHLSLDLNQLGKGTNLTRQALEREPSEDLKQLLSLIEKKLERLSSSEKMSTVSISKFIDSGDYATAIELSIRAIEKWPTNDIFFQYKGHALFLDFQLEAAETELMQALKINPQNTIAQSFIEDIRNIDQAQTSEELAEWISIAKDKVGDFVVTFLALFAAFIVNSLIAPLHLKLRLNRSRKSLEKGNYDEFTDLMEGLLDLENFAPIRENFQFLLRKMT